MQKVTIRHVNRLRVSWGLNRDKGRPRHSDSSKDSCSQKNLIRVKPDLPFIRVSVFDDRMEQNEGFSGVMLLLKQAIEQYSQTNPGEFFLY